MEVADGIAEVVLVGNMDVLDGVMRMDSVLWEVVIMVVDVVIVRERLVSGRTSVSVTLTMESV